MRASFRQWVVGVIGAVVTFAAMATPCSAQQVELAVGPAPYYIDTPIVVQVTVSGFQEEPQPEVRVQPPAGTRLISTGISPSVSTMMQVINGRFESTKSVKFVYRYEFTATTPGNYSVGPFIARQGTIERQTGQASLEVMAVPTTDTQKFQLVLPDRPVRVGERVPVELQWWAQSDSAGNLFNQRGRVPLLSDITNVRIVDVPVEDSQGSLVIETSAGAKEYPARAEQRRENGKLWFVRTVPFILIPVADGKISVEPSTLTVDEALRWRRDFFGQRTATQTRRLRAADVHRTLEVLALPEQGRPESFAGAVGSGFSISVDANRTVVATGEPVTLGITLKGDSTLESASLPPLARAGLDASRFSVPTSAVAGLVDGNSKRFEVTVRVRDNRVSEIPPIEYSWFDPEAQEYRRTTSQPIALSVREAEVVGADAVVRGTPSEPVAANDAKSAENDPTAAHSITYTLTGADLALEHDVRVLLADQRAGWGATFGNLFAYGIGLLCLVFAAWRARQDNIDPKQVQRRAHLQQLLGRVEAATGAKQLAKALQELAANVQLQAPERDTLRTLLAELETIAYAPAGSAESLQPALQTRVRELATALVSREGKA